MCIMNVYNKVDILEYIQAYDVAADMKVELFIVDYKINLESYIYIYSIKVLIIFNWHINYESTEIMSVT